MTWPATTPLRVSIEAGLVDLNVFRLGLGDFDLRLEFGRIGHAREVGARRHPLPHFDGQLLQHTGHAGFDMEVFDLASPLAWRRL